MKKARTHPDKSWETNDALFAGVLAPSDLGLIHFQAHIYTGAWRDASAINPKGKTSLELAPPGSRYSRSTSFLETSTSAFYRRHQSNESCRRVPKQFQKARPPPLLPRHEVQLKSHKRPPSARKRSRRPFDFPSLELAMSCALSRASRPPFRDTQKETSSRGRIHK